MNKNLKNKLTQKVPGELRDRVFSQIERENQKPYLAWGTVAASFVAVAVISFWNWQKNSMPLLEDSVVETIEIQELLENQELFAEVDAMELEEEEWQILTGGQI